MGTITTHADPTPTEEPRRLQPIQHVAAAVHPYPPGQDAAALGAAIAEATGADLMLVAIEPDLPLLIPGLDWQQILRQTENMLKQTRSSWSPHARVLVDSDVSTARGLRRVVRHHHRQLLAVGSRRHGPDGEVSIGRSTRQLIDQLECPLAIAPRGLSGQSAVTLRRIGVGFDGGPESRAALATAATIAAGCGAQLVVRGVIDDRIPALGWPQVWLGEIAEAWKEVTNNEAEKLRGQIDTAVSELAVTAGVQVVRGRSGASLRELSTEADLLVIGSRRWGPMARLLLGGTGEALVHGAHCSLLIVPRPSAPS
jgi:nucleotide-binding universal stress UspA family protein